MLGSFSLCSPLGVLPSRFEDSSVAGNILLDTTLSPRLEIVARSDAEMVDTVCAERKNVYAAMGLPMYINLRSISV